MRNVWFKMKTCLLPVLSLILAMTGCGSTAGIENPEENLAAASEILELVAEGLDEVEELAQENAQVTITEKESLPEATKATGAMEATEVVVLDPDGVYTTVEDVSLYLYTYGELPDNFMTKKEARELGWSGGSLEEYAPGMCIGGDYFGNYEGLLPKEKDRDYYGRNLDALYDALTDFGQELELVFVNFMEFAHQMPGYAEAVENMCVDAQAENSFLHILFD